MFSHFNVFIIKATHNYCNVVKSCDVIVIASTWTSLIVNLGGMTEQWQLLNSLVNKLFKNYLKKEWVLVVVLPPFVDTLWSDQESSGIKICGVSING